MFDPIHNPSSSASHSEFATYDIELAAYLNAAGYSPLRVERPSQAPIARFTFPSDATLDSLVQKFSSGSTTVGNLHDFISSRKELIARSKRASSFEGVR